MPFLDTPNKAIIRRYWDLPILEAWQRRKNGKLSYFGLPGPEIHDLLDWRGVLSQITAIEMKGRTKRDRALADEVSGRLLMNVMINGLSSGFQLMKAEVEDVIINALDDDGNTPQLNNGQPAHLRRFNYDLINLDFVGGLGYKDGHGKAKRTAAIKKLFERQAGQSFLLFLTVNVRDTLKEEYDEYLINWRERNYSAEWSNLVNWYLQRPKGEKEFKLKATIPSFIHSIAEPHMFKSRCFPPVFYEGSSGARMLHFVFELESEKGNLRSFSHQTDHDLIALPLFRCQNDKFSLVDTPANETRIAKMPLILDFLPQYVRDTMFEPPLSSYIGAVQ